MLRLGIAAIVFAAIAAAQVTVKYTPEPMSLTRKLGGQVVEIGAWNIRACNESPRQIVVDAERIYMAAPIGFVGPARAAMLIEVKQAGKAGLVAGEVLDIGGMGAAFLVAKNSNGVVGLLAAVGAEFLPVVARTIIAREGDVKIDAGSILREPLVLGAGRCAERLGFTQLMPRERVHPYEVKIDLE